MATGEFDFTQLDRFAEDLDLVMKSMPTEYDKLIDRFGNKILSNAAEQLTQEGHVKSKRLIDSFKKKTHGKYKEWILQKQNKGTITGGSQTFYSEWLDEGHRWVVYKKLKQRRGRNSGQLNRKRRKRAIKKEGLVAPTHYFEKSFKRTENEMPEMVEKFLEDTLGRVFQ